MDRRTFVAAVVGALPLASFRLREAAAQDTEFIRALDQAQEARPQRIAASARIAAEGEPGTPLVLHGQVRTAAGQPVDGAIVFAYHTDHTGLYDRPGSAAHSWRLRGWARTGPDGGFEFRTIRPAAYPSRQIPAHVHMNVYAPAGRYSAGELRFADDPLVPRREHDESERAGEFKWVRPVAQRAGAQHVDFAIKLDESKKF
jgi:protocatechuate 3,4-dioxygenase beta subunit